MPSTKRLFPALGLAFGLALAVLPVQALHAGPTADNPFGLGLQLGGGLWPGFLGNLDLSGKYWLNKVNAVDMELGGGNDDRLSVGADYLWHNYKTFNRRDIALYYGVGGYANAGGFYGVLGVRGKLGVDWLFPHSPWEAYVEVAPSINLIDGLGFGTSLEGGARYYFF